MEIESTEAIISSLNPKKDSESQIMDISFDARVDDGLSLLKELSPALALPAWKDSGDPNLPGLKIGLDYMILNCHIQFFNTMTSEVVAVFDVADLEILRLKMEKKFSIYISGKIHAIRANGQIEPLWHWMREPGLGVEIYQNQITID